jgi:cell division control protein 24
VFPGFENELRDEEDDAGDGSDPVTILWRFLRRGYPLMALYNATNPRVFLEVDPNKVAEKKRGQAATFKFVQACKEHLGINETFMVTDLYGDDTTGFVKVCELHCRSFSKRAPLDTRYTNHHSGYPGGKSSIGYTCSTGSSWS